MMKNSVTLPARADGTPLYQQVKDVIVDRILAGDWAEGTRIPSENQLTERLGISRMTAHRALRELTGEGWLARVQGAGTFVAEAQPQSAVLEIQSIADEIKGRCHKHHAEVHLLRQEKARALEARLLGLATGAPVFHSLILHREETVPVQLEDRYVNPAVVPDYLEQDFEVATAYDHLMRSTHQSDAEHVIMAVLPEKQERRLLEMKAGEPCLLLRRRTWAGERGVTWVRLLHPGDRYRLGGAFRGPGSGFDSA